MAVFTKISKVVGLAVAGPYLCHRVTSTPYDFCEISWGFVKDLVYANKVNSMERIKRNIREAFNEIDVPML